MNNQTCGASHSQLWVLFILDFFTKLWACSTLTSPVILTSFLSFDIVLNTGISWSMFSFLPSVVITVAIGLFLFFLSWYSAKQREQGYCVLGEKLVIVGGTGNLLDRLYYGGVIDFIHFSYAGWSFPIFNIADICICVGVGIMLWQAMFNIVIHD